MYPPRLVTSEHPPSEAPPLRPAGPAPDDTEVVQRSLADPTQFAVLFDRHAVAVHRYLSRRVGELTDDLLSETFLIAFRRRSVYQAVHVEVRPWLLGIATNLINGHRRGEQRRLRALSRGVPQLHTPPVDHDELSERFAAESLRAPIAAALAALRPADRDVLLLFAWEQLTYGEIASALDVPIGTVRSRLNRARRQTRAALGPALPPEDVS